MHRTLLIIALTLLALTVPCSFAAGQPSAGNTLTRCKLLPPNHTPEKRQREELAAKSFTQQPISDAIFRRMQGRSYPKNCTVKREDLRYLSMLHCDKDGNTHKGEMVCNKRIANDLLQIFRQLYISGYPIERMVLVDEYDGDDERSMQANNTSCFNYRPVPGTKSLSKHALGMAIDINPRYNPYVRSGLVSPDNTPSPMSRPEAHAPLLKGQKAPTYDYAPYIIRRGDLLYTLFIKHGFQWGGAWRTMKDYQHFDKR